jgi:two-component system chemotaxis response regulator CheV
MDRIQHDLEERVALTSNNKFELMLFRLGKSRDAEHSELYGINVFKVRELMAMPAVNTVAGSSPYVLGVVNIRGQIIPVLDLPALVGCTLSHPPKILIITEFARTTQAFAVEDVNEIVRLNWSQVRPAEACASGAGTVTSIAQIDDPEQGARLVQVLDVEQILHRVTPIDDAEFAHAPQGDRLDAAGHAPILAADDSSSARTLIGKTLESMGLRHRMTKSGKEAWEALNELADQAQSQGKPLSELVSLMLTDLEMPEMDGFTLTRKIKADKRFASLPVIIHSSLSGDANEQHIRSAGADAYVAKFKIEELGEMIEKTLQSRPASIS